MVIPNIINLVIPNKRGVFLEEDFEYYSSLPKPEYSEKNRKKINRLFREVVGSSNIPNSEVDNFYERARSKVVRKINIIKHKLKLD